MNGDQWATKKVIDKAAAVLDQQPPAERVGWLTYLLELLDNGMEEPEYDDLLVRLLRHYDIRLTNADLIAFSQAFWAQSIDFKCQHGWRPQSAAEFPERIYEALSSTLERSPEELEILMGQLIAEWKRQAGEVLARFGYRADW